MIIPLATYGPRFFHSLLPEATWRGDRSDRIAYFTFDDGPSPCVTEPILETLEQFNAQATFFMLGEKVRKAPDLVRTVADAGHAVGAHGFTHADPWRQRIEDLRLNFEKGCAAIEEVLDEHVRVIRPPYGHHRPGLSRWARRTQRTVVMWDVMPGDFLPGATAELVAAFVRNAIRPGSIIVLHDNPRFVPIARNALCRLLSELTEEGWQFRAI